eukprot:TRINITY_DN5950_c2_g6_i1.p1 TRINITY_DN5950_c2_g6~~TRINITY_DN5950_c2_g6_i1.p1  ORF type:complete len:106 (+),score=29.63 TRINITY_DN5950_c2_g6_i1:70-387(+)
MLMTFHRFKPSICKLSVLLQMLWILRPLHKFDDADVVVVAVAAIVVFAAVAVVAAAVVAGLGSLGLECCCCLLLLLMMAVVGSRIDSVLGSLCLCKPDSAEEQQK